MRPMLQDLSQKGPLEPAWPHSFGRTAIWMRLLREALHTIVTLVATSTPPYWGTTIQMRHW